MNRRTTYRLLRDIGSTRRRALFVVTPGLDRLWRRQTARREARQQAILAHLARCGSCGSDDQED